MALTRKFLEALGVPEAAVSAIIDEHTAVTSRMQTEIDAAKKDAEQLPVIQKELDDLKAEDYKGKYESEKKEHDALKTSIAAEKSKSAKESALKAYFEGKNIKDGNLAIAMRGVSLDSIELDGDKIKDTKDLDALVDGDFKPLVSTGKDTSKGGGEKKAKVVDSGAKSGVNESGGGGKPDYSLGSALREIYSEN